MPRCNENPVSEALRRALVVRRSPAGLVSHSDQASQYTAILLKDLVAKHGAMQSMGRRGNCYDNAHAESFWSRFKAELLDGGSFPGLVESATTSPITTPNDGTLRSAANYPTTSKPNLKPRPNWACLSQTSSNQARMS